MTWLGHPLVGDTEDDRRQC